MEGMQGACPTRCLISRAGYTYAEFAPLQPKQMLLGWWECEAEKWWRSRRKCSAVCAARCTFGSLHTAAKMPAECYNAASMKEASAEPADESRMKKAVAYAPEI